MNIQNLQHYDGATGLEALFANPNTDPRALHNAVSSVVSEIEASRGSVPADLRRTLEELEADIAETFFNNVPV